MQTFLHDYLRVHSLNHIHPGKAVVAPPCGSPFIAIAHAVSIDAFYDTDADTIIRTYDSAIQGTTFKTKGSAKHCLGRMVCSCRDRLCMGILRQRDPSTAVRLCRTVNVLHWREQLGSLAGLWRTASNAEQREI